MHKCRHLHISVCIWEREWERERERKRFGNRIRGKKGGMNAKRINLLSIIATSTKQGIRRVKMKNKNFSTTHRAGSTKGEMGWKDRRQMVIANGCQELIHDDWCNGNSCVVLCYVVLCCVTTDAFANSHRNRIHWWKGRDQTRNKFKNGITSRGIDVFMNTIILIELILPLHHKCGTNTTEQTVAWK